MHHVVEHVSKFERMVTYLKAMFLIKNKCYTVFFVMETVYNMLCNMWYE